MKFSIEDFFSKSDEIRSFLRIRSYLLKKFLIGNFIFVYRVTSGGNFTLFWYSFPDSWQILWIYLGLLVQ